ncbi:hypothetical protein AVEN_50279-1 [Araneus ventricosus]|uniref:Uncharacterized protein n=1 Tax=Araneus ventricosus TaxID=182803 RepID=A0A4Y2G7A2_ARAVE|nr:hypothetical protein AVEN_50279-1 [Araneus ventricosus]
MNNISNVNAHAIYVRNMARISEKTLSRKKFAIKLSEDLAPWMKKSLNAPTLSRSTRTIIRELLKLDLSIQPTEQSDIKKKKNLCILPVQFVQNDVQLLSNMFQSNVRRTSC